MNILELKKTLASGGVVLGSEVHELAMPAIAELYAAAGFDFIMVDCEHTSIDLSAAVEIFRVARGNQIAPFIRVAEVDYALICRALDQGANGIIVPRVTCREQVAEAASMVRYPPTGRRGIYAGGSPASYRDMDPNEYVRWANDAIMLAIMLESKEAIDGIDNIISVPGVDLVLVGPADLSLSIGHPFEFEHPLEVSLMRKVVQKCRDRNIPCGCAYWDVDLAKFWVNEGMQFVWIGNEVNMIASCSKDIIARFRG
ncbi:MAG: aldolase/citrate lyase family protein [Firmicutes bacterium]|nr:aldolase/citrate lyase family protein [Bacillota bacterium]